MDVREVEARCGRPREAAFFVEYDAAEFAFLTAAMGDGRNQDCTVMAGHSGRVALIRKPLYPPGCFRAPGGSPAPGEDLAAAAGREALEELGIAVHVERYVLRAHVTFRRGTDMVQWITHVFTASAASGALAPRDQREVAEAPWFTLDELRNMNARLAESALGGLRYRAALQQAILAAMNAWT